MLKPSYAQLMDVLNKGSKENVKKPLFCSYCCSKES